MAMWCFVPDAAFGQPGSAWTAGVNFETNSPAAEDTWAFDAVEMPNGDMVVVGYAEINNGATRVPAYAAINKYGELLTSQYYPGLSGGLFQVARFADGTYAIMAGSQGIPNDDDADDPDATENADAFLAKLKYENQSYSIEWTSSFAVGIGFQVPNPGNPPTVPPYLDATITGQERLSSVEIASDGKIVMNGHFRKGNTANPGANVPYDMGYSFITIRNSDGTASSERIFSEFKGQLYDCKIANISGEDCIIFTGFKQMGDERWQFEVRHDYPQSGDHLNSDNIDLSDTDELNDRLFPIRDRDVVIGKFSLNNLQNGFIRYYNGLDYEYSTFAHDPDPNAPNKPSDYSNPNTNIWDQPDIDECPLKYGPCTPGLSANGWGFLPDGSKNGSPAVDAYLDKNSCDMGRSIVYKNGYIYVAAEMNTLEFTGSLHQKFQHSQTPQGASAAGRGVLLKDRCDGEDEYFSGYKDAYVHLIRIKADGTGGAYAKNVAHLSGGDFFPAIVIDQSDGNIVLGGNSGDEGVSPCFPEMDNCHYEENFLMKIDIQDETGPFETLWEQTHLAYGEGNCNFGLIQTADGGFALIGNNELANDVETFNIVRFTADCQGTAGFDQDGDHTVSDLNEVWTPANKLNPYRIRGNIIIPSGKQLTIRDGLVVEFASTKNTPDHRKSGITVQQGGTLYVTNNAVLKGINCGGEQMWDGVTVLGDPNQPAGVLQGKILLTGNARIENAVRGAVLGDAAWKTVTNEVEEAPPSTTIGTTLTDTYMDNLGMGGGRITAGGATFLNCGRGVVWNPHIGFSNNSLLVGTKFEFTGALADPLYAFMGDVPSLSRPTAAELGCRIRSVRDARFINCSFISSAPPNFYEMYRNRPSGIYATDAKFSFAGGAFNPHFKDLYIGAESASMLSGAATTLSFSGAKMDNVYQGLNVRGNIAPFISGCEYHNIPDQEDNDSGIPAGTVSVATQGITLSANLFDSDAAFGSYGAIVNNSLGTGGAKVEHNTFTDFNIANQFEQDNASLQTHCNTYQGGVGDVSWNVMGILANQGDPLNSFTPKPDNKFIWECGVPLLDIRNTNPAAFSYFERFISVANTNTILKCTENVTVIHDLSDQGPANCVIEDPCPNPPYCNQLMGLYISSGNSLPYRNDLLNAYVRMSPDAVADSLYLPGTTRAITLLVNRNQQEDKRILAATYASLGNYSTAQQYLQQVTGATTEIQDFISYYTVLINAGLAGRDAYHLTATEFGQLAPLMTHNSTVAENVKVLDHILNGVYHPLEAESGTGGRPGGERSEENINTLTKEGLRVLPNPFEDEVRFFAPEGTVVETLSIVDVSGKTVYSQKLGDGQPMLVLNTASMPQGVLFYQCQISNGRTLHGKIIHNSKK
ncbi:MAG: hypothetical protein ACKVT2_16765 [Saprospiraceae bacterium]